MRTNKKIIFNDYPFLTSNLKRLFCGYHHYEEYNGNNYQEDSFEVDYGFGINHYEHVIHEITDGNTNISKNYVVAQELLSDTQRIQLRPYCACDYCTSPFKYFLSRPTSGCLNVNGAPLLPPYVIEKARYRKNLQDIIDYTL